MKIFSVKVGPSGPTVLTGSTLPNIEGLAGKPHFASGVAVSVLPSDYQRRLQNGEQISAQEFNALNVSIVE